VSVALGIQHAMRMRHIFLGRLSGSTIFSTLSHKGANLKKLKNKKKILFIKCVLIFSTTLSETFLTVRRTERDTIIKVYWLVCT